MLRFFVGLSVKESAEVLGLSVRTVERGWRMVKTEITLNDAFTRRRPPGRDPPGTDLQFCPLRSEGAGSMLREELRSEGAGMLREELCT